MRGVRIVEFVTARNIQKRDVDLELFRLQQMHTATVRMELHRPLHQPARQRLGELAAQTRRIDLRNDAALDVLDQGVAAIEQRARREREILETRLRQRIDHCVHHLRFAIGYCGALLRRPFKKQWLIRP